MHVHTKDTENYLEIDRDATVNHAAVWQVLKEVQSRGEESNEEGGLAAVLKQGSHTRVREVGGSILNDTRRAGDGLEP